MESFFKSIIAIFGTLSIPIRNKVKILHLQSYFLQIILRCAKTGKIERTHSVRNNQRIGKISIF